MRSDRRAIPRSPRVDTVACLFAVAATALLGLALASPAGRAEPGTLPRQLVAAALERTAHRVIYDGRYRALAYPGGDVPDSLGVCTDVIVRSYRAVGIDLQERIHLDMTADFAAYPPLWGLTRPDPSIDHRRVPNLQVFFRRHGTALPPSDDPDAYRPGDIVTWLLPGNLPHIGLVADRRTPEGARPLIVHNIGRGPRLEDALFTYPITGHYRYPLEAATE
jgi:uncharacterized protein YijF (DUF1287 family)